jgi:hypothetical protein
MTGHPRHCRMRQDCVTKRPLVTSYEDCGFRRWSIWAAADERIVAYVTEAAPLERILTPIGEPAQPPPIAPARGPPPCDDGLADAIPDWDALAQSEPEHLFDQQVQW